MRLQFDRDSAECAEEKRTRLARPLLRVNRAFERHASKIYTRAMFEKFGEILYEAGYYEVEMVEFGKIYIAKNIQADKREQWSRVRFRVTVAENRDEFDCECGQFQHMGLLCCHILKIMDHLDVKEIPEKHIKKRWTVDARDVLPDHLAHYQRDQLAKGTFTFRHSNLYIRAMQLVRLGDTSVESYEKLMDIFKDALVVMQPYGEQPDGLGLEEQLKDKHKQVQASAGVRAGGVTQSETGIDALRAPSKKRPAGRPTNSRDKAPYEGTSKRTRFCMICRRPGHKSTTCPDRGDLPKKPRRAGRCTVCGVEGHRKDTCLKPRGLEGC